MQPLRFLFNYPKHLFSLVNYIELLKSIYKDKYETVISRYPATKDPEINYSRFHDILTFYGFTCPNRRIAIALSSFDVKTYLYKMTKVADYLWFGACSMDKVCHASELPLVFGSPPVKTKFNDYFADMARLIESISLITDALLIKINSLAYTETLKYIFKSQTALVRHYKINE